MRWFKEALLLLRRHGKSGELKLMIVAFFVAIFSVTSIVLMVQSFHLSLEDKSGALLGGDRVIVSSLPMNPLLVHHANTLHLKNLTTVNFLTMAVHHETLALVDIRAVKEGYPLRGEIRTAKNLFVPDESWPFIPEKGTIWLEARLFPLLNIKIGDDLLIGRAKFKVTRVLTAEPDRTLEGFNLAPWALINEADLAKTEVIQPGSRITYKLYLSGSETFLDQFKRWAEPQLSTGQTWVDARHSRPLISLTIDRINDYLGLVFLVNIAFSGIAILMVLKRFCEQQWDTVAVLRCFGVKKGVIVGNYISALTLLSLIIGSIAIILSYIVGYGILSHYYPMPNFNINHLPIKPLWIGFGTVFVLLIGFVLPSLFHLNQISPLQILHRQMGGIKPKIRLEVGIALVMLALLVMVQVQDFNLGINLFFSAVLLAFVVLTVIFWMLKKLATLSHYTWFSMRLNIRNMVSRPYDNSLQILAYTLVLSFIGVVSFVRFDLISLWQGQIPKDAPNYFVINIPPNQLNFFENWLKSKNLKPAGLYPMLSARLLTVNQEIVAMNADFSKQKRIFPRLLNLTWTDELPLDNEIIAGDWFKTANESQVINENKKNKIADKKRAADKNESVISIEKGFAQRLDIKLGDSLTFQIGEKKINSKVTSIRSVEWNSFRPNFYVIFPSGVLESLPFTYITSFYLPLSGIGQLRDLIQHFPMVNLVSTEMVVREMEGFFETALKTVELLWGFTLIISFILLWAAITSTLDARKNEAVLIRIFGVGNTRLRGIVLSEFVILGLLSGILAAITANGTVYWLTEYHFHLPYHFNEKLTFLLPLAGIVMTTMMGWLGTRSVLLESPMRLYSEGGR